MTYVVSEVTANPPLQLSPTTAVFSGTFQLGQAGAMTIIRAGEPAQDFGFFVPEVPPLAESAELPAIWAEAYLMLSTVRDARFLAGVDRVGATYLPDPRGGTARWLHCGGMAYAPVAIRVGYRITVQDRILTG